MSRLGASGNRDCAQLTRVKGTRSIFSNTLAQLTATRTQGRPFMVIQGPSGSGGPVNSVSIAAETGGINLTPAEFAAVVASEAPASDTPAPPPTPPPRPLLAAPTDDISGTTTTQERELYTIQWNAVAGATHYRVFTRNKHPASLFSTGATPTGRLANGTSNTIGAFFDFDAGLQTGLTYQVDMTSGSKVKIFVFANNNDVRGEFPTTELLIAVNVSDNLPYVSVEIWPTIKSEYTGVWDITSTTNTITITNLYSGLSVTDTMYNCYNYGARNDTTPPTLFPVYLQRFVVP